MAGKSKGPWWVGVDWDAVDAHMKGVVAEMRADILVRPIILVTENDRYTAAQGSNYNPSGWGNP